MQESTHLQAKALVNSSKTNVTGKPGNMGTPAVEKTQLPEILTWLVVSTQLNILFSGLDHHK